VIKDKKILLMWRKKNGREYYAFPGGGVERDETVEEAVLRELKEETSIEARVVKLLYHHHYIGHSDQFFYLCSYIWGRPKLEEWSVEKERTRLGNDLYKPLWVNFDKLIELLVYPLEIRDWLIEDFQNNFASTPRKASLKFEKRRQALTSLQID